MRVVLLHLRPCFLFASHTPCPQFVALVPDLGTQTQSLCDVVQLVAGKAKAFLRCLQQVNLLVRSRRLHEVTDELFVQRRHVELGTVVVDDGICFIQQLVDPPEHALLAVSDGGEHDLGLA